MEERLLWSLRQWIDIRILSSGHQLPVASQLPDVIPYFAGHRAGKLAVGKGLEWQQLLLVGFVNDETLPALEQAWEDF